MENTDELSEKRSQLMDRVQIMMADGLTYRSSFDKYSHLWVDDQREFMRQFLLYGHIVTHDELEQYEGGVPENPPSLKQFEEQVCLQILLIVACIVI